MLTDTESVQQLKDDIIENQAYHILLLDLQGTNVDDSVIDVLFHFIEIGLFPCLRIMDFYGCSLTSQAVLRLIQWLTQFPFIDVLSPDLLKSKLAPNTFSQLSALLTDSQGAPQTLDIRSINFPLLLSRCQSW